MIDRPRSECFRRKIAVVDCGKGVTIFGRIDAVEGGRSEQKLDAVSKHIIENARPKQGNHAPVPVFFFYDRPSQFKYRISFYFGNIKFAFRRKKTNIFKMFLPDEAVRTGNAVVFQIKDDQMIADTIIIIYVHS